MELQKFQFLLLAYWRESPGFLKVAAQDVVRTVLCVVIFKTCIPF